MCGPRWPPVFVHGPPKFKNCSFCPKLRASCAVIIGRKQDLSVVPGSVFRGLLNADKNGRLNRTQIVLWHAEHWISTFFECPSIWWLILGAAYVVCVCGYNTGLPQGAMWPHISSQIVKNCSFLWKLTARCVQTVGHCGMFLSSLVSWIWGPACTPDDSKLHFFADRTSYTPSVCKSPFPSAATAVSLFRAKTVQQRLDTEERRNRAALIEVFKLCKSHFFHLDTDSLTRGLTILKIRKPGCHRDMRKYFFSVRVINTWNSLSKDVIQSSSVNMFEWHLQKVRETKMEFFMD